jgi:hypothetical protein
VINRARELSVNNLQRLYAIVMSLSIAESLRRLLSDLGDKGILPELGASVAVFSLLVTAIPYYHGANRYLEATYITGERQAKSQTLIFDFLALFIEGLIFFTLAVVIKNISIFFTLLAILYIYDSLWVGITHLTTIKEQRPANIRSWMLANFVAAIMLLIFVWSNLFNQAFWSSNFALILALGATALIRTMYDYYSTWDFYFPQSTKEGNIVSSSKSRKSK